MIAQIRKLVKNATTNSLEKSDVTFLQEVPDDADVFGRVVAHVNTLENGEGEEIALTFNGRLYAFTGKYIDPKPIVAILNGFKTRAKKVEAAA